MSLLSEAADLITQSGGPQPEIVARMLDFNHVQFNQELHAYAINGKPLISATTFAKSFKPPFDSEAVSAKVAKKRKETPEAILKEWEEKSIAAMNRGSVVHAHIQDILNSQESDIIPALAQLPEMLAFEECWRSLQSLFSARVLATELVIGDEELGFAGTVDAIIELKFRDSWVWCVFDWKTGERFAASSPWGKLLPPFENCDDCELSVYSIQTSVYKAILQKKAPHIPWADAFLIHLRPDGSFAPFRARDYTWMIESSSPKTAGGEEETKTLFQGA